MVQYRSAFHLDRLKLDDADIPGNSTSTGLVHEQYGYKAGASEPPPCSNEVLGLQLCSVSLQQG